MTLTASAAQRLPWIGIVLMLGAVAAYAAFLYQYALNIPLADDVIDVLQVLLALDTAQQADAVVQALFAQHNDHRTAATRGLYWVVWQVTGVVDFRVLTFLANAGLLGLLGLFYWALKREPQVVWLLALAALLLFHLRAFGITLWPMAAFAYFYVYLYGFASLLCLRRVGVGALLVAIACAVLATFTLASGQTVWFVGAAILVQQCFLAGWRHRTALAVWLVAMGVTMWAWRYGLETPNTMVNVLSHMWATPGHHVLYFFTLLGNALSETHLGLAAIGGFCMFALLLASTWQRLRSRDLALESLGWFIALSAAAMVLGRASFSEVEYALGSRYSFPGILMLVNSALILAVRFTPPGLRLRLPMVLLAAVYCASTYVVYSAALQPHVDRRVKQFNSGVYWVWGEPLEKTAGIVQRAADQGMYHPPDRPYPAQPLLPWLGRAD